MGDNLPTVNLGTGRTATAITAGDYHTCALLDNRAVKCWGFNRFGQLGYGDQDSRGDDPREMGNALPTVDLGTGRTATVITAGGEHTCALLDNGSLKCWGSGLNGRLGAGGTNDRGSGPGQMGDALPAVELGTRLTIRAIAAGGRHTCAVLNPLPAEPGWEAQDASVTCWGDGGIGQLGYEVSTDLGFLVGEIGAAVDLGAGRAAAAVSAGKGHTCALLDNSTMKCWGSNFSGELGQGIRDFFGNEPGEMGDALPPIDLARPVRRDVVRPDGLIRPSNQKLRGNDVYNTTGARQTARAATTKKPVRYTWRIQNDGNVAGRFTLRGTRGTRKFVVIYKNGAKDITRAVTKGTYRLPRLGAAASANITVTVRPTTRARPTDKITVTLTTRATDPSSTSANPPPAITDTVRAITTRR
jgi:alpha-tubulin suppressor-like RCC1 family protein